MDTWFQLSSVLHHKLQAPVQHAIAFLGQNNTRSRTVMFSSRERERVQALLFFFVCLFVCLFLRFEVLNPGCTPEIKQIQKKCGITHIGGPGTERLRTGI